MLPLLSMPFRRPRLLSWPVRRVLQTVLVLAIAGLGILVVGIATMVPLSSETARGKIVGLLSYHLDSEVQLESLRLRVFPRLRVEGAGLTIHHKGRHDEPPLISIRRFSLGGGILALLRKHVSTMALEGLDIQIPPRHKHDAGDEEGKGAGQQQDQPPKHDVARDAPRTWVIDELVSKDGQVVIIPRKRYKQPKVWAIHALRMRSVWFDRSMPYEATLTNAVPPGEIVTKGTFGPWQSDEPDLTRLDGTFTFDRADLGYFRGIAGLLSARGTFDGALGRIDVHGITDIPEFIVKAGEHAVPLHATFHTIVDGTNGDTILERVDASFLQTSLVAKGGIVDDTPGIKGRTIDLDVTIEQGRLEDVLRFAVKGDPPMTGALRLTTRFVLPTTKPNVADKLQLEGQFAIADTRFTKLNLQAKINALSHRSRGRGTGEETEPVASDFTGTFTLAGGTLTIPAVAFDVPGAIVRLSGSYGLAPETLHFAGTLFMDAKVSETTTGFKRTLLKIIDPLFRKKGGGSAIPIKITGTRKHPSFGLDKGRLIEGH